MKFKLRYIDKLRWDGLNAEAVKRRVEFGNDFHLLARRYFLGIDSGLDLFTGENDELNCSMENLEEAFMLDKDSKYLPEYKLRFINSEFRLEANFDLLVINSNSVQIWDWKTQQGEDTRKVIPASKWIDSLQSIVYLFVLQEKLSYLVGDSTDYKEISMHYWQPYPPKLLAKIQYNDEMHREYGQTLKIMIQNIYEYNYNCFDKAQYSIQCKFCEFNRLCNGIPPDYEAVNALEP
jgi:hypothetical protein